MLKTLLRVQCQKAGDEEFADWRVMEQGLRPDEDREETVASHQRQGTGIDRDKWPQAHDPRPPLYHKIQEAGRSPGHPVAHAGKRASFPRAQQAQAKHGAPQEGPQNPCHTLRTSRIELGQSCSAL